MKNKLNEPDVETTLTTFNSDTGESITINKTIPSQQFKDIFVTGTSVIKQNYTEEEIIEEWEALGYVVTTYIDGKYDWMNLVKPGGDEIVIELIPKSYEKYDADGESQYITFQEHQLLTKTFKWLGWEV